MGKIFKRTKIKIIFGILFFLILVVGGVLTAYFQEKSVSPDITLAEVAENTIITMLGEYPDKPHSLIARSLQLLWFAFSVLIFGLVVGKISSIFITYSLEQRNKMKIFKDHIVVCNWNQRTEKIIQELFESHVDDDLDIVVVSAAPVNVDEIDISDEDNKHFYFIHNDPTQHSVLTSINAQKARSIVILADEKSESPDDKSVLIALAVKHLENVLNKNLHVVAELIDVNRERHLKEAGADEIVCSMSHCSGIIAQSALFKNMSEIYQRLLSYSNKSNEIYFVPPQQYSKEYIGMDFVNISHKINDNRKNLNETPVLLLGVKHKEKILLNPKGSEFSELAEGDSLIIMAFNHVKKI